MILQYGNLTLLSVEELNGGMFPKVQHHEGVKIYGEEKWKLHHSDYKIFGINIEVPDMYPILKYPEARRRKKRQSTGYIKVNEQAMLDVPPPIPDIIETRVPGDNVDGSLDPSSSGILPTLHGGLANKVVKLSEVDEVFEQLRQKRCNLNKPVGLHAGPTLSSIEEDIDGEVSKSTSVDDDDVMTDGVGKHGLLKSNNSIRRAPSGDG